MGQMCFHIPFFFPFFSETLPFVRMMRFPVREAGIRFIDHSGAIYKKSFSPWRSIGAKGERYGTPMEVFEHRRTHESRTDAKKPKNPNAPEITIINNR